MYFLWCFVVQLLICCSSGIYANKNGDVVSPTYKSMAFLSKLDKESKHHLPKTKHQFASQAITRGQNLLEKLARNPWETITPLTQDQLTRLESTKQKIEKDELFFKTQHEYLNRIIALSWALYNKAVEKNQAFTGGTIVVIDPDYKLYNVLFNYVRFVNNKVIPGKNPTKIFIGNKYGYPRLSSHFPETQKSGAFEGQYGIDIRFSGTPNPLLQPLLPSNKKHILFGKLPYTTQPLTFIKFEYYGLSRSDSAEHLGQYVKKKKKDIKGLHKESISRREDVPKQLKQKFEQLLLAIPSARRTQMKKIMKDSYGHIRGMNAVASLLINDKETYSDTAQQFLQELQEAYDFINLRRGSEVIIDRTKI